MKSETPFVNSMKRKKAADEESEEESEELPTTNTLSKKRKQDVVDRRTPRKVVPSLPDLTLPELCKSNSIPQTSSSLYRG